MEISVAQPPVLPDAPLSLADLAATVREWGLPLQRRAMAPAWEQQAALRPPHPLPGVPGRGDAAAGHKVRQVETIFGPVRLRRARSASG